MVSTGSPGSGPLCERGQDWARQTSCSQSHNKGGTHPASLPGRSGEDQASRKEGGRAPRLRTLRVGSVHQASSSC